MKVFQYSVLALGLFEFFSNAYHLSRGSVSKVASSSRKQHQEISLSLPDAHFFWKAVIMFVFGVFFLAAFGCLLAGTFYAGKFSFSVAFLFGLYGLVQALVYYRQLRVWPAMMVYNIPLVLYFFGK